MAVKPGAPNGKLVSDPYAERDRLRAALREITEVCRSGDFYEDYDESCAIIGRCDKAMEA